MKAELSNVQIVKGALSVLDWKTMRYYPSELLNSQGPVFQQEVLGLFHLNAQVTNTPYPSIPLLPYSLSPK